MAKPAPTLPGVAIPGRKNARAAKNCQCSKPKLEEIRDGNDAVIAIMCRLCMRHQSLRCRVCGEFKRDLDHHLVESEKCGAYEKKLAELAKGRKRP